MKMKTNFRVLIQKGYLAFDYLEKPHLEACLPDRQGQIGLLGEETHKGIASTSRAEDEPHLHGV
jgi:hypothetical protein